MEAGAAGDEQVILLLAVIAGLLAGLARVWCRGRHLSSPRLRLVWLVPLAFLPQWLAFYLPATRQVIANDGAAIALVSSQALLLVFAWFNRDRPGFWMLGLGLALNLLVIALNGGLMPISPETVERLAQSTSANAWQIGSRLGTGKDIVLTIAATRLWWLSDRFLLPDWFPYRAAFSLGDTLIAAGAFWLLWAIGGSHTLEQKGERFDQKPASFRNFTLRYGIKSNDERSNS